MTGNNPKLNNVNADVNTKFSQILSFSTVLKILSGNEILTSIKGHNSIKILRKMTGNNPKLYHVNVDVHTIFGQILSFHSQDIERKRNSDINIGPSKGNNSSANLGKLTCIDTVCVLMFYVHMCYDLRRSVLAFHQWCVLVMIQI